MLGYPDHFTMARRMLILDCLSSSRWGNSRGSESMPSSLIRPPHRSMRLTPTIEFEADALPLIESGLALELQTPGMLFVGQDSEILYQNS
jgi:hypothetical protein